MKTSRTKPETRGRKRAIEGEVEKRLLQGLSNPKFSIKFACAIAGISRRTFYDECARNRVFKGKAFEARNTPNFFWF